MAQLKHVVTVNGVSVPVKISPFISESRHHAIMTSHLLKDHAESINPPLHVDPVKGIEVQWVFMFGPKVGFMIVNSNLYRADGSAVNSIGFLRGGTVVLLPILVCEGEAYVLFTLQARAPIGDLDSWELMAGMVDGGTFQSALFAEMVQELGILPDDCTIMDMTRKLGKNIVFFTPGGSDERAKFYVARINVSRGQLHTINGRITGELSEREHIELVTVPFSEALNCTNDQKSMLAILMLERLVMGQAVSNDRLLNYLNSEVGS